MEEIARTLVLDNEAHIQIGQAEKTLPVGQITTEDTTRQTKIQTDFVQIIIGQTLEIGEKIGP